MTRVETLIDSMDQLAALYARENELIAVRDRDGLRELADTKQRLARAHEEAARAVARDPACLAALETDGRQRLQDTALAFHAACTENAQAVRAAIQATNAVAGTIVHAINRARELEGPVGVIGYGRGRRPPSTSFNQVL